MMNDKKPAIQNAEVRALIDHFGGLGSGTVGDAILEYLASSDCSPSTRKRVSEFFEREEPAELKNLRDIVQRLINSCEGGRIDTMGMDRVYTRQINVKAVERWKSVLSGDVDLFDNPPE